MKKILSFAILLLSLAANAQVQFFMVDATPTTPSVTTYLQDSFTGADATNSLSTGAHVPDINTTGGTWSASFGTWGITGNKAKINSGGTEDRLVIDGGHTDGTLSADITLSSATDRTNRGLVFRYTSTSSWIKVQIVKAGGVNRIEFRSTSLQTFNYPFVDGQTYNLKVVFVGDSCSVYINNVFQFVNTNPDNDTFTGTKVGLVTYDGGTTNDDDLGSWDNITFTSATN